MAEHGIYSAEGIRALDQILSSEILPGIIVTPDGLADKRLETPVVSATKRTAQTDLDIEGVLAEWWRELLGVEKIGLDDDFFDLGGHSLIAVRLFSKIKKAFEVDLGLSILFEARTIRQLAALVRQAGPSRDREDLGSSTAVVPIREGGSRLPLFLLSGLGGEVIGFDTLARCLGGDQPVYALQPQGLDGRKPFLTRVEDMAAYYLDKIREVQSKGPYCLAGYSFGGYVVFEIAQQLHAAGETVALLGFLDTIEYQYLERVGHPADFRQRWALRLDRLTARRWDYVKETVASNFTKIVYRLFYKLGRPVPQRVSTLQEINRFAMSLYRPTVYPGHLTIFRSVTRSTAFDNDELLGWGGMASHGIEVQDITGRHLDILKEPNVLILAEKLRVCLDRIQPSPQIDGAAEPSDVVLRPAAIVG